MRNLLLAFIFVASTLGIYAQDDDKDKLGDGKRNLKGVTGLNVSQTASSNWSAGGEGAMAGTLYINESLVRKSGNWLFSNTLVLEYGLTNTKSLGTQKTVAYNF